MHGQSCNHPSTVAQSVLHHQSMLHHQSIVVQSMLWLWGSAACRGGLLVGCNVGAWVGVEWHGILSEVCGHGGSAMCGGGLLVGCCAGSWVGGRAMCGAGMLGLLFGRSGHALGVWTHSRALGAGGGMRVCARDGAAQEARKRAPTPATHADFFFPPFFLRRPLWHGAGCGVA